MEAGPVPMTIPPHAEDDPREPVTVVVATRNRREPLLSTLARLAELPEQPRIVVVDNASTDGTAEAARRAAPHVEVVALDRNVGAAARTVGVRRSGSSVVAFSDDDSWWAPGALSRAARLFHDHPRLGLVGARILVEPGGRPDPIGAEMERGPIRARSGTPGSRVLGFLACGAVVRASAFLSVGGFHPRFGVGGEEDLVALDLAAAGWELVYRSDVVAHHEPAGPRDPKRRREIQVRNRLWTAWLRWPSWLAIRATAEVAARSPRDVAARRGMVEAARDALWAFQRRRPLPRDVAADLARLRSG